MELRLDIIDCIITKKGIGLIVGDKVNNCIRYMNSVQRHQYCVVCVYVIFHYWSRLTKYTVLLDF